ncbi:hypothetical protein L6452_05614 [Arctium lappa]|uniref:Uncharacterized protein n=1 Tax=Arctium lappa TaxID=4217 RepID=A0ACB9EHX9_ARCLA|nr:hypothetical protein L6452_05614 [Arctium lappa]
MYSDGQNTNASVNPFHCCWQCLCHSLISDIGCQSGSVQLLTMSWNRPFVLEAYELESFLASNTSPSSTLSSKEDITNFILNPAFVAWKRKDKLEVSAIRFSSALSPTSSSLVSTASSTELGEFAMHSNNLSSDLSGLTSHSPCGLMPEHNCGLLQIASGLTPIEFNYGIMPPNSPMASTTSCSYHRPIFKRPSYFL